MIEPLQPHEFEKIRDLLVSVCGIELKKDQDYLVETRLTELATEIGSRNFGEFHRAIIGDPELLPKVVDLMTTNETLWFRDESCWRTIREVILPKLLAKLEAGAPKVRIWSAASSTGQEAYSFTILVDETLTKAGKSSLIPRFEVMGTDISSAAVFLAKNGRYDPFTISRGLSDERRDGYFHRDGNTWVLNQSIRDRVSFNKFNLMNSFEPLGKFDLVLCRNVAIYFSEDFKKDLFAKIAKSLVPDGNLMLGATESLYGMKTDFENLTHGNGIYYRVKRS